MSTAVFYSLSIVSRYLTMYRLMGLCHYVHSCLLQSVLCLSVPHNLPSVGSVSLCPLIFRQSVHCLSVPHTVPSDGSVSLCPLLSSPGLSTVPQYLIRYLLLVLCHCVHCCLLQSLQCLSIPQNVPSVSSVSLYSLLSSTVCPLSLSSSHLTVC